MAANYSLITEAIPGVTAAIPSHTFAIPVDSGRSPVPQVSHDRQPGRFFPNNFERVCLRPLSVPPFRNLRSLPEAPGRGSGRARQEMDTREARLRNSHVISRSNFDGSLLASWAQYEESRRYTSMQYHRNTRCFRSISYFRNINSFFEKCATC